MRNLVKTLLACIAPVAFSFCWAPDAVAQKLVRLGPGGGQVISLAAAEKGRVLLGTADGHIFASADEGRNWLGLTRAQACDNLSDQYIYY